MQNAPDVQPAAVNPSNVTNLIAPFQQQYIDDCTGPATVLTLTRHDHTKQKHDSYVWNLVVTQGSEVYHKGSYNVIVVSTRCVH